MNVGKIFDDSRDSIQYYWITRQLMYGTLSTSLWLLIYNSGSRDLIKSIEERRRESRFPAICRRCNWKGFTACNKRMILRRVAICRKTAASGRHKSYPGGCLLKAYHIHCPTLTVVAIKAQYTIRMQRGNCFGPSLGRLFSLFINLWPQISTQNLIEFFTFNYFILHS